MKQIYEVEEKPFTSSCNICLEGCCRKGRSIAFPLIPVLFPADPWGSSFKDDVNVIHLLGVSVMLRLPEKVSK
jgi:hypothetical protein